MTAKKIFFVSVLTLGIAFSAFAQEEQSAERGNQKGKSKEIVMDEILIEGRIEKPNVTLLPNREKTLFEESAFPERSFQADMVELPPKAVLFEKDFDTIKRLENVKTILKKMMKRTSTAPFGSAPFGSAQGAARASKDRPLKR